MWPLCVSSSQGDVDFSLKSFIKEVYPLYLSVPVMGGVASLPKYSKGSLNHTACAIPNHNM